MSATPAVLPSRWIRVRLSTCLVTIGLLFGVVIYRAHRLQIIEGPRLRDMAEQQYLKAIELPPRRGTVFDRHGTPLSVSVDVDSVYANPRLIGVRAKDAAEKLAQALGLEADSLEKTLSTRRYFAWVKRRISPAEAREVKALALKGIELTKESQRFYPNYGLAAALLGFAGSDARGLEGLELAFDEVLRGSPARVGGLRDALGRQVLSEGARSTPSSGADLVLSLDKFIQFETEQAIAEAFKEVRPKTGWVAAMVMDPATGDILAMASLPTFDPNRYSDASVSDRRNRVVTEAFEPGSTIKVFTIGAALEAGILKADEIINCEKGAFRVGKYTIHDSHPYEELSVPDILKKSSNICTAKIAFRMGKTLLHQSLKRFGFGQVTGLSLPGERSGTLFPSKRWSDVALANIGFGQGLTTTVIQLTRGLAAVANDGILMEPRLLLRMKNERGAIVRDLPPNGKRVMSASGAQLMMSMLRGVTEAGGTGVDAALERWTVAGKTGTAQRVDPVTGTYAKDLWVSSFIGATPATKPRLIITVVVHDPAGEKHYGGEVAGPVFKRIGEKALSYLGVRPDRPNQANVRTKQGEPAAAEGYLDEEPAPPLPGEGGPKGQILVPDFTGMSLAEVLSAARAAGIEVELEGTGLAVGQSPGPGPSPKDTSCRVSLRPPG